MKRHDLKNPRQTIARLTTLSGTSSAVLESIVTSEVASNSWSQFLLVLTFGRLFLGMRYLLNLRQNP